MFSSGDYWERRYSKGRSSGAGSYNKFAEFKAEFVNALIEELDIKTVIEFGVGDGNQLEYFKIPKYYGVDVSKTAIKRCQDRFINDDSKKFCHYDEFVSSDLFDLSLSLDVIYHLIEDEVFSTYMNNLFTFALRFVCIYSSNDDALNNLGFAPHVKHRNFTSWVDKNYPDWSLIAYKKNRYPFNGDSKETSFSDFFVFSNNAKS